MDSQPDINVRVRASNFSGRFNYLKKNESYISSHSWEIKALILARLLGRRINLDNMKIESLYPDEMGPDVMPLLDKKIEDRTKQASANGNVLRYVCLIDDVRTSLCLLDKCHCKQIAQKKNLSFSDFCCFFGASSSCSIALFSVGNFLFTAMEANALLCLYSSRIIWSRPAKLCAAKVEIYIRCYEKQPSVIQGTGAGNDTTAAGVLADIQDLFP
ncbi:hypothetical protein KY284_008552 [Solanum tuberosum]|nr:hypothetical protein KY284_008552 [Solanum tuberosum]